MDLVITLEVSGETLNTMGPCIFVLGPVEKGELSLSYHADRLSLRRLPTGGADVAEPRGEVGSLGLWSLWRRSVEMLMRFKGSELGPVLAGLVQSPWFSSSKIYSPSGSAFPSLSGTVNTPTTRWPSLQRCL